MKELIRRRLGLTVAALLAAGSRPLPLRRGPVLVIAPHPDDETLGCGGLIAVRRARGDETHVAVLTDGAASHPGHPFFSGTALARRRRQETLAAARQLGLDAGQVHFLDAPDGRLDRLAPAERRALQTALARLADAVRPREVFVPLLGDGSTEHDAAHWHTRTALALAGQSPLLWEYPVWAWWNPLRLTGRLLLPAGNHRLELGAVRAAKIRALACHATQLMPLPPWPEAVLPSVLAEFGTAAVEFYFHRPQPLPSCPH